MVSTQYISFLLVSFVFISSQAYRFKPSGLMVKSNQHTIISESYSRLYCTGTEFKPVPKPDVHGDGTWKTKPRPNIGYFKQNKFENRPEIITFDAIHTLIEPSQSVGKWLREALNTVFETSVRLPRPNLFYQSFVIAYEQMSKLHPCFGARTGITSKEWWAKVIEATYRNTKDLTTVTAEELTLAMPALVDLIYETIFSTKYGWDVKEDVEYTLRKLIEWRDQGSGPKIGVISNSDSRLIDILKELDLEKYFDIILTSHDCGFEKPEPQIFKLALERTNVKDPRNAFHIGNSVESDINGAVAAGWNGLHYIENFDETFPDWSEIQSNENTDEGFKRAKDLMEWGRKNTLTNVTWTEIWGLDDILFLFGFPEDPNKKIATTLIRGFKEE